MTSEAELRDDRCDGSVGMPLKEAAPELISAIDTPIRHLDAIGARGIGEIGLSKFNNSIPVSF
jgi:hypothetical protein